MTTEELAERFLDHAHSSLRSGRLSAPSHRGQADSLTCGDQVVLELQMNPSGFFEQAAFEHHGCLISRGAASLLCEYIEGKSVAELLALSAETQLQLIGIPLTPLRRRCGLLAWNALQLSLHSNMKSPADEPS